MRNKSCFLPSALLFCTSMWWCHVSAMNEPGENESLARLIAAVYHIKEIPARILNEFPERHIFRRNFKFTALVVNPESETYTVFRFEASNPSQWTTLSKAEMLDKCWATIADLAKRIRAQRPSDSVKMTKEDLEMEAKRMRSMGATFTVSKPEPTALFRAFNTKHVNAIYHFTAVWDIEITWELFFKLRGELDGQSTETPESSGAIGASKRNAAIISDRVVRFPDDFEGGQPETNLRIQWATYKR